MQALIPLTAGLLFGLGIGYALGMTGFVPGNPIAFAIYGLGGGALARHFPSRTELVSWVLIVLVLFVFGLGAAGFNPAATSVLGLFVTLLSLWFARIIGRIFGLKPA